MSLVDELTAIHLVTFCGTVSFRQLKALKSQLATAQITCRVGYDCFLVGMTKVGVLTS